MRGEVGIPGKNQQASAKAGKVRHRRTLSNYLRRLVRPPFHVLSARGPYLKMQECAVMLCYGDMCECLVKTITVSFAGEIPSQNLSNYSRRLDAPTPTSFLIVSAGRSHLKMLCCMLERPVHGTEFQASWNRRLRGGVGIPGKNQQASAKAGKARHRRTLSNYLRRLELVHSTSFPCVLRSGTLPEDARVCGHVVLYVGRISAEHEISSELE
ncbi:hypothetical protein ACN42_g2933 [Penicillium freii]|uniref:Uncharacterized protein n=1 Tax=Penicillium freii TaxID=48697 RepID=A0A101MP57_PENFR|nr:hypothetical protein ACN42_g2933 [Penicillium freii]